MATSGIIPRALRKGDTIALLSPSGRYNDIFPIMLARGRAYLRTLGYETKVIFNPTPENIPHHEMILHRCAEVHQAFLDPDISAILCTAGGAFANELLPHLDYELITAHPKIFCGFSDITILHYALFTQCNLRTFYGPVAIFEFGEFSDTDEMLEFTARHFQYVLCGSADEAIGPLPRSLRWSSKMPPEGKDDDDAAERWQRELQPSPAWQWLRPGKVTGRIFGGCLSVLQQARGTKFWPDHRGRILMIETALGQENPYDPFSMEQVRTCMADLVNTGVLDQISGLVIGRPHALDEDGTKEFFQIILDQCCRTNFPILVNVDVGHTDPMLTIPLNAMAILDSDKDEFSILEPAVSR